MRIRSEGRSNRGELWLTQAVMEGFCKTLEYEEVYMYDHETFDDVIARLPYFVEEAYNQKRLHSALGYRCPNDIEELMLIRDGLGLPRQTLRTLSVQSWGAVHI